MTSREASEFTQGVDKLAFALHELGKGGAASPMGAIEFLAVQQREGFSEVASAINNLADAIREMKSE